jgi:hypothetical protein
VSCPFFHSLPHFLGIRPYRLPSFLFVFPIAIDVLDPPFLYAPLMIAGAFILGWLCLLVRQARAVHKLRVWPNSASDDPCLPLPPSPDTSNHALRNFLAASLQR